MSKKRSEKPLTLEDELSSLKSKYQGRLAPPLEGLAYRFMLWIPVQAKGKPVFTPEQLWHLFDMFHHCFGGCSHSRLEGFPPWTGSWLPKGADEPIVDHHIQIIAYALQDKESVECMRELKRMLQQEHIAAQEVVLIEQIPFVEAAPVL